MSVPPVPASLSSDGARSRLPLRRSLRRGDFLRATRHGRRLVTQHFILFVYDRKDAGPPRLGITVTRKVGNAVRRNRIKRLVREWFRLGPGAVRAAAPREGAACDLIVIAKRDISRRLTLAEVCEDLEAHLPCPG